MKKVGQIRENYNILTEKDDAEMRKLTSLVRAGLFDAKKLPMLKRALNKDPKDMTPAERKILIELLDSLMGEVLGSQQVYQKVRQDVMKEELSEAKTSDGYLSKYDPRYDKMPNEKQIPAVIILKRKAIRIYPDNQKVALYYSQALDKYVTIPFGNFEGGNSVNEDVEHFSESHAVEPMPARERFKAKRQLQEYSAAQAIDIATDLTPGVSNVKSAYSAFKNAKAGQYGAAAIDAIGALPAVGNAFKAIKSAVKVGKAVKSAEPKTKPSETPPAETPAKPSVKPDNDNPTPIKAPEPKKPAFEPAKPEGPTPKPANDPSPIVPKPEFKPFTPAKPDKAPSPANVPEPTPSPVTTPSSPPAIAPSVKPVTSPAPKTNPSPKVDTKKLPAEEPVATPATSQSTRTSLKPKQDAANKTNAKKDILRSNKEPFKPRKDLDLPGLPSANIDKDKRDPAKFSLAAHISKPKGNVRTGVQKREENLFRKSLQKEEAPTVSYKSKTNPAQFGRLRVNTNRATGNTDVRTGVSARDAMMYRRSLQQNESVLSKLKNINENESLNLTIGDDSVIINNTVANKILTVYESVSKENKKKIEDMLNESVESVKKIINFVARQ